MGHELPAPTMGQLEIWHARLKDNINPLALLLNAHGK